jgi:hypothetical protein
MTVQGDRFVGLQQRERWRQPRTLALEHCALFELARHPAGAGRSDQQRDDETEQAEAMPQRQAFEGGEEHLEPDRVSHGDCLLRRIIGTGPPRSMKLP